MRMLILPAAVPFLRGGQLDVAPLVLLVPPGHGVDAPVNKEASRRSKNQSRPSPKQGMPCGFAEDGAFAAPNADEVGSAEAAASVVAV